MSSNKTLQPVDLTHLTWSLSRSSTGTAGSFLKSYEEINGRKFYDMRVKRYFAPHLIHELLRCYASLRFAPVGAEQTSTGCLAPRNSTHIRNPLIFQGKSQGHQSKIDDSPHVCAGQQVRTLILQAGTSSDLLTLVSFYYKMSNYDSVRGVVGHESVNEIVAQNIADALQIIYEMVKERITWTGRISESSCDSFI